MSGECAEGQLKGFTRHHMLQERKAQVLEEIREPLVTLVRGTPGLTATELFKQTSGTMLPDDITRSMFETMLSTLVKKNALVTSQKKVGTVQRVLIYPVPA